MATGDRRLDRRLSNRTILAIATAVAVAVAVLAYPPADGGSLVGEARIAEPVALSPRCQEVDRAGVAQLAAFLERNRPTDAPILERAIHALNVARRHCLYDWDRGADDYQWLSRWLSENG